MTIHTCWTASPSETLWTKFLEEKNITWQFAAMAVLAMAIIILLNFTVIIECSPITCILRHVPVLFIISGGIGTRVGTPIIWTVIIMACRAPCWIFKVCIIVFVRTFYWCYIANKSCCQVNLVPDGSSNMLWPQNYYSSNFPISCQKMDLRSVLRTAGMMGADAILSRRWVLVTVSTGDWGYGWGLVWSVRLQILDGMDGISAWNVDMAVVAVMVLLCCSFEWQFWQYVELVDVNAGLVSVESWIRPEPWHVEL